MSLVIPPLRTHRVLLPLSFVPFSSTWQATLGHPLEFDNGHRDKSEAWNYMGGYSVSRQCHEKTQIIFILIFVINFIKIKTWLNV
jgi:hypothetical protein